MRVRRGRLAALAIVALGLAPGTWLRTAPPAGQDSPFIAFTPLPLTQRTLGPFAVEGAWRGDSRNFWFGGYSALVALDRDTLLAGADRGWTLRFAAPVPDHPARERARFAPVSRNYADKRLWDLESLTRDPASGAIWGGFEYRNAIARFDSTGRVQAVAFPPAMRKWPDNAGPEGLVRLADGRLLVSAEAVWQREGARELHTLLVFPRDPLGGAAPWKTWIETPAGYSPVDMAQLPGGQVLVLMRKTHFLPLHFTGRIGLYDPRRLSPGQPWRGTVLARLEPPLPTDNYEGMAVVPDARGAGATVWLISDDNRMRTFQRTLLLRLHWPGADR